ncbi:MAG: cache domain-containing protein [Xanthobacteraceae bacterium]
MQRLIVALFTLAGLCFGIIPVTAQTAHTPEQAKAFVEKAVGFLKTEGKEKALAAFSDTQGQWVDGDLYLVVMDANDGKLTMLAHGVNKALIGKPQIDMKDAEGKTFNHDIVDALSTANDIWVTYKWPNPATKKIASKKAYFTKVGDVIIAAGVYE